MDLTDGRTKSDLLFATFNQDQRCFAVGTRSGFRIFDSDPLRDSFGSCSTESVRYAEMLFRCNYVAYVSSSSPDKVFIWDDFKKKSVIDLEFPTEVKGVRLRRDRIVVALEDSLRLFTFTFRPQSLHVFQTGKNPKGILAMSPSSTNSFLAFPGIRKGFVRLIDLSQPEKTPLDVRAHETSISCITLNVQGTKLATASDKGTLIRVFNTSDGSLLAELRRGSQPASIYSINFNSDSSLICASSSNGTIHIFSVEDFKMNKHSSLASSAPFLPKYFNSEWSFSRIEVPGGSKCICAFGLDKDSVIAVCADGSYHKFRFQKGSFTREVYHMFMDKCDFS